MPGWMEAFVIVATLAIVVQMGILVAMYMQFRTATRQMHQIALDMQRKIDPILVRVNRVLENSEEKISSIVTDAAEMTRTARAQAQKVDRVVTEALDRMRAQIVRVDTILTGALETIEDAGIKFRRSFLGPLQQASAVIRGIRTGIDFIRGQRGSKPTGTPQEQDEELFI
ncbi:MAG TPA: hypothetical protein VGT03_02450 [Candidatus Acidoferrales bacterium]|nr:hypothetical protein [Candidatus Acidoferrales bacterium]